MGDTVTYTIELLVGLACLAVAMAAWPHRGWFRLVGLVSAVAGLAAVVHAVIELAR